MIIQNPFYTLQLFPPPYNSVRHRFSTWVRLEISSTLEWVTIFTYNQDGCNSYFLLWSSKFSCHWNSKLFWSKPISSEGYFFLVIIIFFYFQDHFIFGSAVYVHLVPGLHCQSLPPCLIWPQLIIQVHLTWVLRHL